VQGKEEKAEPGTSTGKGNLGRKNRSGPTNGPLLKGKGSRLLPEKRETGKLRDRKSAQAQRREGGDKNLKVRKSNAIIG